MSRSRAFIRHFIARPTVLRACRVAGMVAPTLLLLNQWDLVVAAPFSLAVLKKLALNFTVPYLVSSYSSARAALAQDRPR